MKRELLSLALMCSLSFVIAACDDDGDKDKAKAHGKPEQPSIQTECSIENDTCAEGKYCTEEGRCEEIEDDSECIASNFTPFCENDVAVTCGSDGKYVKEDCALSNKACGSGRCVQEDGDCLWDSDCAALDPSKPFCSDDKVCVSTKPAGTKDPCENVNCGSDTCEWGICITPERKDAANTKLSCHDPNEAYCIGDILYYCGVDHDNENVGKFTAFNCAAHDMGTCVRANLGSRGFVTECSGNADMLSKCHASEKLNIDLCYGSDNYYGTFMCVDDLKGNSAAILISSAKETTDCAEKEGTPICSYDGNNNPVCTE